MDRAELLEQLTEETIEIYEAFYRKIRKNIGKNKECKLNRSEHNLKYIERFLLESEKRSGTLEAVGTTYLKNFIRYSIGKNSGRTYKGQKNVLVLSWVFSKNIINEYFKRDRKALWVAKKRISELDDVKLVVRTKKEILEQNNNRSNIVLRLNQAEEDDKKMLHNTLEGYVWCGNETTMFNHASSYCINCNYKESCLERLKLNYPKIYSRRGYDERKV